MLKKILNKTKITNEDDYIVALDIGTEFTKALIAKMEKNGELTILGTGKAHQEIGNMYSGAIADITGVVKNCEDALVMAEDMAGLQARRVIIGIAGEFVKGITKTLHYKRPNPNHELDMREMEYIINTMEERAAKQARQQIAEETGNPDVEVKLVNSAIVGLRIDGYKVTNPIGFQGKDVTIQLYAAYAPMVHIGALERVATELDLDLLAVAAEPFAVARAVLGNDTSSNYTAILCDIGGGTTDIAVVNDGGVEGTRMFGVGGRSFTKTIANDLGVEYDQAEKLKLAIDNPRMKTTVKKMAEESIEKTLEVWEGGLELALDDFDAVDHLPNRILLCGGGSSLEALVEMVATGDWYKSLPFTKRPIVHHITPDEVADINDKTGTITDHTMITAMGLLRVGYDTVSGGDDGDTIKSKLDKILKL